jgi:hypothetical protein
MSIERDSCLILRADRLLINSITPTMPVDKEKVIDLMEKEYEKYKVLFTLFCTS